MRHCRRTSTTTGSPRAPLQAYAQMYLALALLRESNAAEAEKIFGEILDRKPDGYLSVSASMGKAEAMELRGNAAGAADIYEKLTGQKSVAPEDVLAHLAHAAQAAGDRKRAAEAWLRVY